MKNALRSICLVNGGRAIGCCFSGESVSGAGLWRRHGLLMKITEEIVQESQGMLTIHPEINDWTGKAFHMYDDGGVEVEVGEFLYGLLRVLKPTHILETGTYTGVSAGYMGKACKDNGFGRVETLEIDNFHKTRADELFKRVGVTEQVTCVLQSATNFTPDKQYDFLFLDSEPDLRFGELVRFFPFLQQGGFVFIHDLHRHMSQEQIPDKPFGWPFGELPKIIRDWVKDDLLRPFHFSTPRGFVGFYKTDSRDYKWM